MVKNKGLFTEKKKKKTRFLWSNNQERKKVVEVNGSAWKWERECAKKEEGRKTVSCCQSIRQGYYITVFYWKGKWWNNVRYAK